LKERKDVKSQVGKCLSLVYQTFAWIIQLLKVEIKTIDRFRFLRKLKEEKLINQIF